MDDQAVHEPGEPVEHVVDGEERVGQHDALRRRVRDIPLVPESDVLEPDERVRPHDARDPAKSLGRDRVALVRHGRRALLAAPERLLDLAHLRPGEMADLGGEPVERGGEQSERREQLGMPVALQDLGRARGGLEAELLTGHALDVRLGRGVRADGSGELAHSQALDRMDEAFAVAIERECPPGELEPERRRLGMDTVGAAHAQRLPVLLGAGHDCVERPVERLEHDCAGILDGQRQRRVEHVRGGQPVVEPATLLSEPCRDCVDEGRDVVIRLALDLGHALGARDDGMLANRHRHSRSTAPTWTQPSSAASSTSSHRRSFSPSDQIWLMAGRE